MKMNNGTVTARAPGKVNLALRVGPLGLDGYHPLVTVFQAVDLYEQVTATLLPVGSGIVISAEGPGAEQVPLDSSNLAARAAQALADRIGITPDVALHLAKGVPVAGGMAGGSADAAAALVACNELWGANLPDVELLELGALIGSDVPFCLMGGTALGTGRGQLLTPIETNGTYHWVFAIQTKGLSTPTVFRKFDELNFSSFCGHDDLSSGSAEFQKLKDSFEVTDNDELLSALVTGSVAQVAKNLINDLQPAALALRPELSETIRVAVEAGAIGVIVSGSGPTVAALANTKQSAEIIGQSWLQNQVADAYIGARGPARGAHLVS